MKRLLFVLLIPVLFLTGCASGNILVTGKTRDPIKIEDVTIYTNENKPEKYEYIGKIRAEANKGLMTEQATMDAVVEELKSQAASVGANGVILRKQGQIPGRGIGGKTIYIYGNAIYVKK